MKDFLHHIFIPRESNNFRARALHHSLLVFFIAVLLIGQFFVVYARTHYQTVLGTSIDLSVSRLIELTNEKRIEKGLSQLVFNEKLASAAALKAADMFEKNYWSHIAPDGTTPWIFFKKAEYDYVYAGENLARGFTDSDEVVAAWMASPTHRENMLSPNYKEIGFAIEQGQLLGENTTLVVELFGNTTTLVDKVTEKEVQAAYQPQAAPQTAIKFFPKIDAIAASSNISLLIILFFILLLVIDMIVVKRKKVIRFVGHNLDHILLFVALLLFVLLYEVGVIL